MCSSDLFELLLDDRTVDPTAPIVVSDIIEQNGRRILHIHQRPTPATPGWQFPLSFGIDPGSQAVNPFTPAGELIVCDNYDNPPQEVAQWMRAAIIAQLVRMGCTPVLVSIA